MSIKFGIDLDGVLANFGASYVRLLEEVTDGVKRVPDEVVANPPEWNWDKLYYSNTEIGKAWDLIKSSADFWRDLEPLHEAQESVTYLNRCASVGIDVYFITHRMGRRVKTQSEQWLINLGMVNEATVLIAEDKIPIVSALELDFFIDDKPETIQRVACGIPTVEVWTIPYRYNEIVRTQLPQIGVAESCRQAIDIFLYGSGQEV